MTETFFHAPADVFSFGILCWEVMTRKKPFEALEPVDVLRAIQDGKRCVARLYSLALIALCLHLSACVSLPHRRPPLSDLDSGLQADIIQRCWAHDPVNRPSFQQILESLKPLAIEEDLNVMQLKATPDSTLCLRKYRLQQTNLSRSLLAHRCERRTEVPAPDATGLVRLRPCVSVRLA